ncbi:MAG: hypothetical protein II889_09890 [Clostridia bacterium]|nr:hypothetical protein [Clostridia bacterium]
MKRLKTLFRSMEEKTETFHAMYDAPIVIQPPTAEEPYGDHDTTFYENDIAFVIESPPKNAQDRPIVLIRIPAEDIDPRLADGVMTKGGMPLKRLKHYFRQMDERTETYSFLGPDGRKHDIYDGQVIVEFPEPKNNPLAQREPEEDNWNLYWADSHGFTVDGNHKTAKDRPIVTVSVPAEEIDPALGGRLGDAVDAVNGELPDTLTEHLRDAAADFCLRAFAAQIDILNEALYNRSRPDRENGKYDLFRPGGEILRRNTAFFAVCPQRDYDYLSGISVQLWDPEEHPCPPKLCLCFRLEVQLPFHKLKRAMTMMTSDLPKAVDEFIASLDRQALSETLFLAEKQFQMREALRSSPWCAFVANGSILPRAKDGVSPLDDAVPFCSTSEDEIELCGVRGMGIPRGVTVITGGGYSGKSTLLDAIAAGIYDHRAGDGREFVLTDESAVSIAAEDGRAVSRLNIGPFLKSLPGGYTPADFTTAHASGSTSQASGIMEAVSAGSRLLLIDEDRSATNFMIRDAKMKALIKKEPITPFTDRVRELASRGISTILVIGGSGEYLGPADRVYLMDDYRISDATVCAKEIWQTSGGEMETAPPCDWEVRRVFTEERFSSYPENGTTERLEANDMGFLLIGSEQVDVRGVFSLMTDAQRTAAAFLLRTVMVSHRPGPLDFEAELGAVYERIRREGLHTVYTSFFTTMHLPMEMPRRIDVEAIVCRMRHLRWK